ncbi:hypothetical protein TYRP_020955 [Tyrophagus putrescentiae]|nr:hypothetical protein TYRP_020955 [Tyrophagus putrescentiae]
MFSLPADKRFHSFVVDIPTDNYNWSTDWAAFPGIPRHLPRGAHGHHIMRLSNQHWDLSIYLSVAYVLLTFGLKAAMSLREKGFDLQRPLIAWNFLLAAFSFFGAVRCLPEFAHVLANDGFVASYTQNTYVKDIRVNSWYLFFTLSKAPELIDTLFIVLRKRRLINLHWIHHTLTLIYSWFVFGDMPSTARWMVNMNLVIHSMMYAYYALAAMRIRLPKQVNITITTLQIAQMFAGLYVNADSLRRKLTGLPADLSVASALAGFSLYFLFFALFVNFFIRTYLIPTSTKVVKSAVAGGKTILADLNNNSANGGGDLKNSPANLVVSNCGEMVKKLQ